MQTGTASQLPAKQSHPPKKKNCFWVFGGFWQKVSCFSPPHCDALATVGSSAARTCVPALLHPRLSILAGGCEQTRGGPVGASGFLSVSAPPRGEGGGGVVDEKDFAPPNAPTVSSPWPHGLPCSLNPLPRELPRCAVVGAWFQPFFTYTNTYSGFPAVGCGGLGQQVPRAPQSLRVGVGGRGSENKSWPPLHLARKRPIFW